MELILDFIYAMNRLNVGLGVLSEYWTIARHVLYE